MVEIRNEYNNFKTAIELLSQNYDFGLGSIWFSVTDSYATIKTRSKS